MKINPKKIKLLKIIMMEKQTKVKSILIKTKA